MNTNTVTLYQNRGITLIIYAAVTSKKYYNKNFKNEKIDLDRVPIGVKLHHYIYPFTMKLSNKYEDTINFINKEIKESRSRIPPYMSGNYTIINHKTRASDWEDVLFRIIPSTVTPLLVCPEARFALNSLILACSIAMQWHITQDQLDLMDRSVFLIYKR